MKILKLSFSHVTNLKIVMILHGIWLVFVQDTLFVPNLRHNLISIGKLNSNNYKTVFEGKCCKMFYKNALVVEVPMTENRMFC